MKRMKPTPPLLCLQSVETLVASCNQMQNDSLPHLLWNNTLSNQPVFDIQDSVRKK